MTKMILISAVMLLWCMPAFAEDKPTEPFQIMTGPGPSLHKPAPGGRCPRDQRRFVFNGKTACAKCDQRNGYYPMFVNGKPRCVRTWTYPHRVTPNGYEPKYQQPGKDGGCGPKAKLVSLKGKQRCVSCKPGYVWHGYYGLGRCIRCKTGQKLGHYHGGKVSCLRCPPGDLRITQPSRWAYLCSCPGGKVMARTPTGIKCVDPKKQ